MDTKILTTEKSIIIKNQPPGIYLEEETHFLGFAKIVDRFLWLEWILFLCVCPKKYVWEFFLGRNEVIIVFSGIFKGTFGLLIYKKG